MRFLTQGEGPDGLWRTDEQREEGVRALRRAFARELERVLAGRRVKTHVILDAFSTDAALREAYNQMRWEWAPVEDRPTMNRLVAALRLIEGSWTRFNQRWSPTHGRTLWGFDPE